MTQIDRMSMDVDLVCVGFGPAMGGFLTTLSKALGELKPDGTPLLESTVMPGMPLQVLCYERADDIGFGVSGIVTRGRAIRASFPGFDPKDLPLAAPVSAEKVVYLLDPHGASRRPKALELKDAALRRIARTSLAGKLRARLGDALGDRFLVRNEAVELPYIPPFLQKHDGFVLSMGQFMQWVGQQIMADAQVQIWPATPVAEPLIKDRAVLGVRLADQGVDKDGNPDAGFMPGMDIKARLTVVGDGPVGAVGQAIDQHFGLPSGNHQREWAVGMKMVVELPESCTLEPGTVLHTLGYPEPGIFGFLYVYPDRSASLGIFVPSWFDCPVRTAYTYLQHWMQHPYLWQHLQGGRMRSWGAKSLQESGRRGEPFLVGNGYARIGEGSGTTNVLTGSGVDEAWASGVLLGEAVVELLRAGRELSEANLQQAYVQRRRSHWLDRESQEAERARDGFTKGLPQGFLGMALAGLSKGRLAWPGEHKRPWERLPSIEKYYEGILTVGEIERIRQECREKGAPLHEALMRRAGWPEIVYDGQLLVSHQDALLMGGKVQAPHGYADHVRFRSPQVCQACREQICIECCSGQAITTNPEGGVPLFDREKCVHCGACLWNCSKPAPDDPERSNVRFSAGAGGLHSAEN